MSTPVGELDLMPDADAAELLRSCCGSSRWIAEMLTRRPFVSLDGVIAAADKAWANTGPPDWHEAFAHHPRIGETGSDAAQGQRASSWSAKEQGAIDRTSTTMRDELARVNAEYERRFGHIYIICATGMSAEELLSAAKSRLSNDPGLELRIAAAEQGKITRLRLRKLFGESA